MQKIVGFFKDNPLVSWVSLILLLLVFFAGFGLRQRSQDISITDKQTSSVPSPSPTPSPKEEFVQGQVMVKFKTTDKSVIDQKLKKYNARIIDRIEQLNYVVLEVPPGKEKEVVQGLMQEGIAVSADLNYIYEERFTPNDSEFGDQYGLEIIQAPQAWDVTRGKGIIVANLEPGGADIKHPDLAPNVIVEGSVNGKIAHGTHTSGILVGATNNGQGIAGTCPECKLLMLSMQGYNDAGVAKALVTAADRGAKAISMSFGGPKGGQVLTDAVQYAWDKGCIAVAASGNSNKQTLGGPPGSLTHVVNVAATNASDKKASFSNYHKDITIAAPGDKIISTLPGGKYGNMSGTSMSAPMVAGVVALIWSTSYGTSAQAVVDRLCNTSDKISGTGTQWKCGRVNAFKAVQGGNAAAQTPARQVSPQPTTALVNPTQKPIAAVTDIPKEPAVKPTFTTIGDCVANNNCPPTDVPHSEPKEIAQLPVEQPTTGSLPDTSKTVTINKDGGLLQILIELLMQILQMFGKR